MRILLLSDIHGNLPALMAIDHYFTDKSFDAICNCGDSTVYAPFPNETLQWLQDRQAYSILGNTDHKVITLLQGKNFKKPHDEEKRIMYRSTVQALNDESKKHLLSLGNSQIIEFGDYTIGLFHGSPDHPRELLFAQTQDSRFQELSQLTNCRIVVTGHSHSPYYKNIQGTHFINPGSAGRMFDGNPEASCATLTLSGQDIQVSLQRIPYPVEDVVTALRQQHLPEIYTDMFRQGRKLN
ncbi:MAG: metallophosphatase family protein [Proteobacteria bacterium]|nr:metallophosphatase family protein [Pseudomonadota bacterium]MBU4328253.1 metallophosphatase family protein [Pseudomonadota bacterium]